MPIRKEISEGLDLDLHYLSRHFCQINPGFFFAELALNLISVSVHLIESAKLKFLFLNQNIFVCLILFFFAQVNNF